MCARWSNFAACRVLFTVGKGSASVARGQFEHERPSVLTGTQIPESSVREILRKIDKQGQGVSALLKDRNLDDALDVTALQAAPGVVGSIFVGLAAQPMFFPQGEGPFGLLFAPFTVSSTECRTFVLFATVVSAAGMVLAVAGGFCCCSCCIITR